jgi:hypothetical protein
MRTLVSRPPSRCGYWLVALATFTVATAAQGADGGLANKNTAEGDGALSSLTTGFGNTAVGYGGLYSNNSGSNNTASGFQALFYNDAGNRNTASGSLALFYNSSGVNNTATGSSALSNNTTGSSNTASGDSALLNNTIGNFNTALGLWALLNNTTGGNNTATGRTALYHNTTGNNNTASGNDSLFDNTTGNNNIALGDSAGSNLTSGSNNIDIGNTGIPGEAGKIRIGSKGNQNAAFIAGISGVAVTGSTVVVSSNGKLGVATSSARFKQCIKPIDQASEAILALKPVSFRYKEEIDPDGIPQFGLIAEEVENVNPDLVARDDEGKVYTVRYEAVNAMLLNEFIKEHRKGQEQDAIITQLKSAVAQQQKEIKALTASLKQQASQLTGLAHRSK